MSFLAPTLLAGLLLVGIPIALHLRRRRDPVRVEFPALQLLKRNRYRTETQLRLRRWLLLALRCALLSLLALALARPLLRPASASAAGGGGPAGTETVFALVLDNGPNVAYRSRNLTVLESAQALAQKLLAVLPAETPVVLADRSAGGQATSLEPAAAAARIERSEIVSAARPLSAAIREAVAKLAETPAARREVYVFTDMSAAVWDDGARRNVAKALDEHPRVALRLVDVGVEEPRNVAVEDLVIGSESLAIGEPLSITARLHTVGEWREPLTVQLWIDGDEAPVKRDERIVETDRLAEGVPLSAAGLAEGVTNGFVRVVAGDAAPQDDARFFAVEVRRPRSMLLVAPDEEAAVFLRAAIDPAVAAPGVARRFETEVIDLDAWPRQALAGFDAVALVDPSPLVERGRGWRRLYDFAVGGGGMGVFLGGGATLDAFNSPDAQAVLPAELKWRSREETFLEPPSLAHPAVRPLAPYADAILWRLFPVFQHWELAELREGSAVVARYAQGAPAVVEQGLGRGRVVVMTTSVSDRLDSSDPWNRLPTGDDPWPFVLLARSLADYLTGATETRLVYTAGEVVTAPLPVGFDAPGYVLRTPGGDAVRQAIPPATEELSIRSADTPGAYRIEAGADLDRRFVVNLDPSAAHLERVSFEELKGVLGAERVRRVRGDQQLASAIDLGRVGRELYGWALALAAAALVGEQWVGNRYYRQTKEETQ